MHEGGGLQGIARMLFPHVMARHLAKLAVNQRSQTVESG
jgi:hypothetical protein